ncbi:MAG TPA: NAD(P)H-binding protein [Jatrophihabitans sp.]|jgi:NADH dehydrogenase|uniref:SDR family oxidoreductase n=1 Tax=Jatrophihabitans sp. TaxID=1932789 RepID=UPI002EDF88F2
MILVAGGTGLLGSKVVDRLVAAGQQVRVLTRDRQRARRLPAGVDIVEGDVRRGSMTAAVQGCACVVSAVHGFAGQGRTSPEAVDRAGNQNLIAAATAAGVSRFVLVSVAGAAPDHPMSLHRMKYAAEQQLQAAPLTGLIVRPTAFLQTWLTIIGGKLASGGPALVLGPGRNPINFVAAEDVAAFVCLAVGGDPRIGPQITVGGGENLTFTDIAERLLADAGRSGPIKHVPLGALRAMSLLARPVRPSFARQAAAAVVMNTIDMSFDPLPLRERFPDVPALSIDDVLRTARVSTGLA